MILQIITHEIIQALKDEAKKDGVDLELRLAESSEFDLCRKGVSIPSECEYYFILSTEFGYLQMVSNNEVYVRGVYLTRLRKR